MAAADYPNERSDEIVEPTSPGPLKIEKFPTRIAVIPLSGSEGDNLIETSNNLLLYPTVRGATDQIQVPNGGKSIKSAVMKIGEKFKAAVVNAGKKSWATISKASEKFGPSCVSGCASGGIQALAGLATD